MTDTAVERPADLQNLDTQDPDPQNAALVSYIRALPKAELTVVIAAQ